MLPLSVLGQMYRGVFWWQRLGLRLADVFFCMLGSTAAAETDISGAIAIPSLPAWISPYLIFCPHVPQFFHFLPPSLASLPFIYQIAPTRSQLDPVGGSFLGWISVKWTHGIGRQSVTLSRDEREWEWWAPRRRCRVEGQKFMLQMHLRSMIISPDVRPHDT